MRDFDRKIMLRLVNHNKEIAEAYLEECKANGDNYDRALELTYLVHVVGVPALSKQYESLFDNPNEVATNYQVPDSPIVAKIRALVNEVGWQEFVWGLYQFAKKKSAQLGQTGLWSEQDAWEAVAEKFRTLRKRVQL